jgi:RimJ/RimL family protein N-acetyltransferase
MTATQTPPILEARPFALRDGRQLLLRVACADDAPAMLVYLDELRRTAPGILFSVDDELPTLEKERQIIEEATGRHALRLVAVDGDRIVAAVGVSAYERAKVRHRAVLGMGILTPYRGQGLGAELLGALVDFCERDPQIRLVELGVLADNEAAIRLYRKTGFRPYGMMPDAVRQPDGSFVDQLLMWRSIEGGAS